MIRKIYRNIVPQKIREKVRYKIEIDKLRKKSFEKGETFYYFRQTKSIFIHIPKAGGISIIKSLYGENTKGFGHPTYKIFLDLFKEDYYEFFKFTFVRNPWDRVYSAYTFLTQGGLNEQDRNFFEKYLKEFKTFEDFVLNGLDKEYIKNWIHFIPQYTFIYDENDRLMVDFVGRFENFENDFNKIANKINSNAKLKHLNKSKKKKSYVDMYNDKMIEKVYHIYKKDIDLLNYDFGK